MVLSRETLVYRRDASTNGTLLTPAEREALVAPYLPPPKNSLSTPSRKTRPVRTFLQTQLHTLVFNLIHTLFSLYIRLRHAYHAIVSRVLAILYYHHRTPELIRKDVRGLSRLPEHLSVILELQEGDGAGLEVLLDEVAEVAAWCACVGIPVLSVYERTGALKTYIPATHRVVATKLHEYFGKGRPSLQVRAPHMPSFLNGDLSEQAAPLSDSGHLSILLLSSEDGRSTLVDLTKTLAEMSQHQKLLPSDISPDLIDAEINESVMSDPELLLLFGPYVNLQGYPPWQLRLTEIFHIQDNVGVEYQVFLRALHNYAKAQMRLGSIETVDVLASGLDSSDMEAPTTPDPTTFNTAVISAPPSLAGVLTGLVTAPAWTPTIVSTTNTLFGGALSQISVTEGVVLQFSSAMSTVATEPAAATSSSPESSHSGVTTTSSPSSSPSAAIVGGVVAGLIGALLMSFLICWLRIRRGKKRSRHPKKETKDIVVQTLFDVPPSETFGDSGAASAGTSERRKTGSGIFAFINKRQTTTSEVNIASESTDRRPTISDKAETNTAFKPLAASHVSEERHTSGGDSSAGFKTSSQRHTTDGIVATDRILNNETAPHLAAKRHTTGGAAEVNPEANKRRHTAGLTVKTNSDINK
ncbi:hypothetical protein MMC18_000899 [Xylographa bjoerkii]|nr:hypothetical protein [Xylographa bjoerkii]